MAKHRSHSVEFKRQVAQAYLSGESLHGLAKQHDLSRNLIRIWVAKLEAGEFEGDAHAADVLQTYEAKIAALERMVAEAMGLVQAQPAAWQVHTGTQIRPEHKELYAAVEKDRFLALLHKWQQIIERAREIGMPVVCFGD